MLSSHEIKQIVEATIDAGKEVFVTKDEFYDLSLKFDRLQTSVDIFARKLLVHDDEIKIINHRLRKLENPA